MEHKIKLAPGIKVIKCNSNEILVKRGTFDNFSRALRDNNGTGCLGYLFSKLIGGKSIYINELMNEVKGMFNVNIKEFEDSLEYLINENIVEFDIKNQIQDKHIGLIGDIQMVSIYSNYFTHSRNSYSIYWDNTINKDVSKIDIDSNDLKWHTMSRQFFKIFKFNNRTHFSLQGIHFLRS